MKYVHRPWPGRSRSFPRTNRSDENTVTAFLSSNVNLLLHCVRALQVGQQQSPTIAAGDITPYFFTSNLVGEEMGSG